MKKLVISISILFSILGYAMFGHASHGPYDPKRDPFKDFEQAQLEATNDDKLILITIGGNWCSWCIRLERFFDKSPQIKALMNDTFVVMKVNVSTENYNEDFLNRMPEFEGYPFLVITNPQGEVLSSLTSGNLEEGSGYSKRKFREYFEYWKNADKQATIEPF